MVRRLYRWRNRGHILFDPVSLDPSCHWMTGLDLGTRGPRGISGKGREENLARERLALADLSGVVTYRYEFGLLKE
ncbi:MAG: hypothetical protein WC674_10355 [Candidatus Krumholzibacteriia bacterium]